MSDVFISYSRKDKPFVEQIHAGLKIRNREVWVDWEDIRLTADWWHDITTAIENADTFVFIMSPDSCASPICNFEIAHAAMYNKRIVPIFYRPVNENDALETLGKVKPNGMMQEILGERDLLSVASESWRTLARYNWVYIDLNGDFDAVFEKLLIALDSDFSHIKVHTRLLVQALDWERTERNAGFLLAGDAIIQAEKWLEAAASEQTLPAPTDLHCEYIIQSRAAEDRRIARLNELEIQTRRSRRASSVLAILIVVAIIITGVALIGVKFALDSAAQASFSASLANTQAAQEQERAALANTNEALANTQVALASTNEALANTQAAEEEARAATAQKQAADARNSSPFEEINSINTSVAVARSASTASAIMDSVRQFNSASTSIAIMNSIPQLNYIPPSIPQGNYTYSTIPAINLPATNPIQSQSNTVRATSTRIPTATAIPSATIQVVTRDEAINGNISADSSQHWHYAGQVGEVLLITVEVENPEDAVSLLIIIRDPHGDIVVEHNDTAQANSNSLVQLDEFTLTAAGLYDIEVQTTHETTVDYSLIIESR